MGWYWVYSDHLGANRTIAHRRVSIYHNRLLESLPEQGQRLNVYTHASNGPAKTSQTHTILHHLPAHSPNTIFRVFSLLNLDSTRAPVESDNTSSTPPSTQTDTLTHGSQQQLHSKAHVPGKYCTRCHPTLIQSDELS